jgi:hypothetical protein
VHPLLATATAAIIATGCAVCPPRQEELPQGTFHLVGSNDPPRFLLEPHEGGRPRESAGKRGITRGVFSGAYFAAALMGLCSDAANANPVAGAVLCVLALPVAVAAIPAGAVVGTAWAAVSPDQDAADTIPSATSAAPEALGPTPRWWRQTRLALLDGVAARATDTGFVVLAASEAPPHGAPRLETAIEALGLVSDDDPFLRPYLTVRVRLIVHEQVVREQAITKFGSHRRVMGEWFRSDLDPLREAIAEIAAEAAASVVDEVIFSESDALVATSADQGR